VKILINGSNGFIGKNLSEFLKKNYDNVYDPKRQELDLTDSYLVKKYLLKNNFDIIIHCAITLNSTEQNLKMYSNFEENSKNYGKMICIGSAAEYDPKHYYPLMKEDYFGKHIPEVKDIYSYSRFKIAEDIEKKNKNIFNLRVFGIYGKYENYNRRFISNIICRILAEQEIVVNQNSIFDYLYIDDFCVLLEKFMNQKPSKKTYNLCTSMPVDLITLAQHIKKISKHYGEIIVKNKEIKMNYTGDNTRFLKEFGDYNFIDHESAIKDLYNWYKDKSGINFKKINFN
jgi:GDP-L-fucose synthase